MADSPDPIVKRRFEIRFADDVGEDWVLGWHDTQEGADRLAASWGKRPGTTRTWVIDLEASA